MSQVLEAIRAAVGTALPGVDQPRLVRYRVIGQTAGRMSLQIVDPADGAPDQGQSMKPIEVAPGVPGVSSTPQPGELVVVAFVGRDQYPLVISRAPRGEPGHVPLDVQIAAQSEVRVLGGPESAAAVMRVGPAPTAPLARAADLTALLVALQTLGATLSLSPDPSAAIVGGAITTALTGFVVTPTSKLEAA